MDAQSVAAVIEDVGESLTLRKQSGGTFDSDTGGYTAGPTETDTAFNGWVDHFKASAVNGSSILLGDLEIWAVSFASGVVPAAGDQVIRSSRTLRLVSVDPVQYGSDPLVYRMQARGV